MAQVFIKEHLLSDNNPSLLISGRNATDSLENGMIVALDTKYDLNTYNVVKPTDVVNQTLVIVNAPVIIEVEGIGRVEGLEDPTLFSIPATRVHKEFKPVAGDAFFIDTNGITGTPVKGQYAIAKNAQYKWDASATVPTTTSLVVVLEDTATIRVGSGANLKTVSGFKARVIKAGN